MAIKNPTKYVTVRRLNRFREKIKAEIKAEFAGPTYDEEERGFTFPTGAAVTYDSTNHGFVFN